MRHGHGDELVQQARALLALPSARLTPLALGERATELAALILGLVESFRSDKDTQQAEVLSRMIADPRGQVFTTLLADRAYRSRSSRRTVEQARYLLERLGAPSYLGALDKLSLSALQRVGTWVPSLSGTAMLNHIRGETSGFILPAAESELEAYLNARRQAGVDVNVNHLGEEVLGEAEAQKRVAGYVQLLRQPAIHTISVKISSICSQLSSLAFESSVTQVCERLRVIYREAIAHALPNGRPKLVTLDMESYRDLELTLAAYQRVLDEPEFMRLGAGIVLQAYLPDAAQRQAELLDWARARLQRGGSPIRIRVVKGANLAMERVESSLRGWPLPIYDSKAEVDANYKRMLLLACEPENAKAAHVGVASHNLFDLCFGLTLAANRDVMSHVSFELLEGMANPLVTTLVALGARVLVYAPIVHASEFPSAIAYLTRRLDENTAPENYLSQSFTMEFESTAWHTQRALFLRACDHASKVSNAPRRTQDRSGPAIELLDNEPFRNEPDTDFVLAQNRRHIQDWLRRVHDSTFAVASSGSSNLTSGESLAGFDPSRPGHEPYSIVLATPELIEEMLTHAVAAAYHNPHGPSDRESWLRRSAQKLRGARAELIALMVLDAGKRVEEADVEVSEAIDFAEYYLRRHRDLAQEPTVRATPLGVVVVTPPWNFPLAIGLGGVFAALVAGNAVILKPPLETPLVAQRACELLWDAGIPGDLLQLVVCRDEVGTQLITDPRTNAVVLTGATSTARLFQSLRPELRLYAETGGKNALIVSAMSDREQAISDIITSAFGHAGQKCSALSQLILEREVYEDPNFRAQLRDAVTSLKVGSAWELDSFVTPMISVPSELQRRALTSLDSGETWLVEPHFDQKNPRLVSPGIKLGVAPGSFTHQTEFFCPLLGVLEARDLAHGVAIANGTPYGLTAGLHSLDEREHDYFIEHIAAGNLYINRKITGAIVQRQPFGGWKASSFGAGVKAGGPHYVAQFVELEASSNFPSALADEELPLPSAIDHLLHSMSDAVDVIELQAHAQRFVRLHTEWFASPHDASQLWGEDNLLCHRPLPQLLIVAGAEMSARELALSVLATAVAQCPYAIFVRASSPALGLARDLGATELPEDDAAADATLAEVLASSVAPRLRCREALAPELAAVARQRGIHVANGPVSVSRFELLHALREQAVSVSYHRHGHMGLRGLRH